MFPSFLVFNYHCNCAGDASSDGSIRSNSEDSEHEPMACSSQSSESLIFDAENYLIPTAQFPRSLTDSLSKCNHSGERLPISMRRLLVRIVANDIHRTCGRPGRSNLRLVAQKVVNKYPCLIEKLENNEVIGSGYGALFSNLEYRFDNLNRSSSPGLKSSELMSVNSKIRKRDSYGCVNYVPSLNQSDLRSQNAILSQLVEIYEPDISVTNAVKQEMRDTYGSQRHLILSSKCIQEIRLRIPFLFEVPCFYDHVENLMGIVVTAVLENFSAKVPGILDFIRRKKSNLDPVRGHPAANLLYHLSTYFREDGQQLCLEIDVSTASHYLDLH